jgi:hypothetical protein
MSAVARPLPTQDNTNTEERQTVIPASNRRKPNSNINDNDDCSDDKDDHNDTAILMLPVG